MNPTPEQILRAYAALVEETARRAGLRQEAFLTSHRITQNITQLTYRDVHDVFAHIERTSLPHLWVEALAAAGWLGRAFLALNSHEYDKSSRALRVCEQCIGNVFRCTGLDPVDSIFGWLAWVCPKDGPPEARP